MKKSSAASYPPAIPSDDPTDGSITEKSVTSSRQEPKKPFFERYDTYIVCPGCGSLIPKGTKQCECGYDLSGPAVRLGRLLRRAVPILLCILLVIAGTAIGYYAGQKSMEPELKEQYVLGYDFGLDAGSKIGYYDGYSVGKQAGYDEGYSAAKKAYSKQNPFSNSSDIPMPHVSWQK